MKNLTTLALLLVLTLLAALASSYLQSSYLTLILLGLGMAKLFLVAFRFMELKKAHRFWKSSFVLLMLIFFAIICVLTGSGPMA